MFEVSHFPAPTAGVVGSIVLLFVSHPAAMTVFVVSLAGWLIGQYIAARTEAK